MRFCPFIAQFVLLFVAVTQRNWMFFAMILPGVLMSFTYAIGDSGRRAPPSFRRDAEDSRKTGNGSPLSQVSRDALRQEHSNFLLLPSSSLTRVQSLSRPAENPTATSDMWKTIVSLWLKNSNSHHLKVAVGIERLQEQSAISAFSLDLVSQGPHALVAGTTGSGKSVFLQSWCAAMAMEYSPQELHFIFLDFKGGATFHTLHLLPHVVGFVSDLDLAHAKRALNAIEHELHRREALIAAEGVSTFDELHQPPPRLVIVVDEFQALRFSLPDYSEHLSRIASQGRSLGMNLILSTQNPSGQVNGTMRANINLMICLRVQDRMQSIELLGSANASEIPVKAAGSALCSDSAGLHSFRSAVLDDASLLVQQCNRANRFCEMPRTQPLFTSPLPALAQRTESAIPITLSSVPIGIADDGVLVHPCAINLSSGNVAVIGPHGKGKTTLAHTLSQALSECGLSVRWTEHTDQGYLERASSSDSLRTSLPVQPYSIWVVDGADELLDPLSAHPLRTEFIKALTSKNCRVIFTAVTAKHLHYPDQCFTRVVFPSADPTADIMSGIPAHLLKELSAQDFETAGRAVLIEGPRACTIQCFP